MTKETKLTIKEKFAMLEVLKDVIERLESDRKYEACDYVQTGVETEQARRYNGELLWEDEEQTIPKYNEIWEYVPKKDIPERCALKIAAIDRVLEELNNII